MKKLISAILFALFLMLPVMAQEATAEPTQETEVVVIPTDDVEVSTKGTNNSILIWTMMGLFIVIGFSTFVYVNASAQNRRNLDIVKNMIPLEFIKSGAYAFVEAAEDEAASTEEDHIDDLVARAARMGLDVIFKPKTESDATTSAL